MKRIKVCIAIGALISIISTVLGFIFNFNSHLISSIGLLGILIMVINIAVWEIKYDLQ